MANDSSLNENRTRMSGSQGVSGGAYGMASIGALLYFIQHATTFWEGLLGVRESIFWPGVLVYELMDFLKL